MNQVGSHTTYLRPGTLVRLEKRTKADYDPMKIEKWLKEYVPPYPSFHLLWIFVRRTLASTRSVDCHRRDGFVSNDTDPSDSIICSYLMQFNI